ncbi:MlaD family protein [Conexibacter sp. SYSU D00693]|uniref:MlaD family protein n=1 Tax=Conexibacter sp. SYSU D00693 TaxID=2812560 RepID=UPI00196AA406|nr:MlaD family protein [Conexibacter sp. SYSU D00693]
MTRGRLATTVLLVAGAAALALLLRAGGDGRELRAAFSSAVNLVEGAEVRAGGVKVGTVGDVELRDGHADVALRIDDDALWPLRRGTQAALRLGGTVSYANRYVELVPGPAAGAPLEDGDRLPVRDTTAPIEFDQVFDTFDPRTRAGLGGLIDEGAATFGPRGARLAEGMATAGDALVEAAATFDGLSKDPYALEALLRSGAGVAGELARRDGELRGLVDGAARTLSATARSGPELRATLARLPGALRTARATLGRVDGSLGRVDALVRDVAPGARELRRTAAPLDEAVGTLRQVAPDLEATLATVQRRGGDVAGFLADAVPQVRRLRPVLDRLQPMLACVRAYAPETAGLLSSWAAFNTGYDKAGRYAWLNGQVLPFPNATPLPSRAVAGLFPQLRYSLVRPPGLSVLQPQPLPSCGATDALQDPANDPESRG